MNEYITYDGKKYRTLQRSWRHKEPKPATARLNLNGDLDVTYGPTTYHHWNGEIVGPITPDDGTWGSYSDLITSLKKTVAVSMSDHYGTAYTVHSIETPEEDPFSPGWDHASGVFYVNVTIVGKAT